jgi:lysophospholipase L1-like esterase
MVTAFPARGQQAPQFWDVQLKGYIDEQVAPGGAVETTIAAATADLEEKRGSDLVGFQSALATRTTSPVDIVVLGDSIVEGVGVAARADRFVNRAVAALRTRLGIAASVGGYIPARYVAATMTGAGFTLANRTVTNIYGLGQRSVSLLMDQSTGLGDGTATITVTCSSFKIAARSHTSNTSLFVTVDGGTAVVWDIVGNSGEVEWSSGALTPGSHTVQIKARSNSAAYIEGLIVYNGDETSGIRLWEGGQSGTRADQFNGVDGTSDKALWADSLVRIGADLVVIEWMTNDCTVRTSAQYEASLGHIVTLVRSKVANVPILFLAPYERGDATAKIEPWANYVAKMRAVAEATPSAAFLDLGERIPKLTGADTYALLADNVHPNAKGHALMGDLLAGFLLPQ